MWKRRFVGLVLVIVIGIGAILWVQRAAVTRLFAANPAPTAGCSSCAPEAAGTQVYLPYITKPDATSIPTLTSAPTITPARTITPTATQPPVASAYFGVGTGSTDVVPHQLVRTNSDRLYLFVSQQYSTAIRVFWTTAAGLPNTAGDFGGATQTSAAANPISVDAVYDGSNIVHVLANLQNGELRDYPFDLTQNSFKSSLVLVTGDPTVAGDYIGTSGASGMMDKNGKLQVAYWAAENQIIHQEYTYTVAANSLNLISGPTRVDSTGKANHPALSVSPVDNAITVAWVSEDSPATIKVRTRASAGAWGAIETVSTAPVWTSVYFGINIDQGPSLLMDAGGGIHLTYIENWDQSGDYGKIHYVSNTGSGWSDQALPYYSHDPALAITGAGQLYIIGHGHPLNQGGACPSMDDMCTFRKTGAVWGAPQLFAHAASGSFDASPSVKWSVVGFNRPETIEFLFFSTPYSTPTVYYARLP